MDVLPLQQLYEKMQACEANKSLAKKYLTPEIVKKYSEVKTKMGGTLALCVNTNAYNPQALLCRTADQECYEVFRDFFDAVIRDYHKVATAQIAHPPSDLGDENNLPFGIVDPTEKYVVSTRVRVGRTIKGFAFAPLITKEDRIKLENLISSALKKLTGELAGEYYSLINMPEEKRKELVADHFLFRDDDSVLRDAGGYRDWSSGRGIFINKDKTFLVWINEEDHMRIISMQKGGDLRKVYSRLVSAIKQLEKLLEFAHHDRFGYITFCPSNLGTTMRASVHVRVPHVSQRADYKEVCEKYNMQSRGTDGEHTAAVGGVYDLSNKRRLGITELQAAKEMADGVAEIIKLEQAADGSAK
jgi:arginine kinase